MKDPRLFAQTRIFLFMGRVRSLFIRTTPPSYGGFLILLRKLLEWKKYLTPFLAKQRNC